MSVVGQGSLQTAESLGVSNDPYYDYVVYCITFPNDKKYIGITSRGLAHRKYRHFINKKDLHLPLYRAISKYGFESLKWTILERVSSWAELCLKEQEYIAKFNTYGDMGYNRTKGGDGTVGLVCTDLTKDKIGSANRGRVFSKETREKMSKSHTGVKRPHISKSTKECWTGRKHSELTKLKQSLVQRGRIASPETKEKMSISRIGKTHSKITKNKMSDSRRKYWESKSRSVLQFDLNGNILAEYSTHIDALKALGIFKRSSKISEACRDSNRTAYGYKWKYKESI